MTHINVVLFCGGRGSKALIREMLHHPDIRLSLLINAYDDGLSTGALRDFIPGMLGPSDFRKNLSYILDLYSANQYALQKLFEFRLPLDFSETDVEGFKRYVQKGDNAKLRPPLPELFNDIERPLRADLTGYLQSFFAYYDARPHGREFSFADCSLGNLIFAGIYLSQRSDFNKAIQVLAGISGLQAKLINVSKGENRTLVGLKADGEMLVREAKIVGEQSAVPILDTFFIEPPTPQEWTMLGALGVEEKRAWLISHQMEVATSDEAKEALSKADIIIYGPGTQHSSLLPSYKIANEAILSSPAAVKAFVVNLHHDHDIQGLSAADLVDRALYYLGDADNARHGITHILYNTENIGEQSATFLNAILAAKQYKGAEILEGDYVNPASTSVHSGFALIAKILEADKYLGDNRRKDSILLFIDLLGRLQATESFVQEMLEIKWNTRFRQIHAVFNNSRLPAIKNLPVYLSIEGNNGSDISEITLLSRWLTENHEEYLVTIVGDGEYQFRDVLLAIDVLKTGNFGVILGSRTQSRRQFISSLRAAYGERKFMFRLSWMGAFIVTALFGLRFGIVFSDPLTGFRVYRRSHIHPDIKRLIWQHRPGSIVALTKLLIRNKVEIAEFPVHYRTFSGFTQSHKRFMRGLRGLLGFFR